ncbi:MAG: gliding motility-associated C-terminal domain-containing protein [Bacteroidales bacterium]|nr:gliding motility-associated C-terminal domain-containing protein [Bacteroidales bacterium]
MKNISFRYCLAFLVAVLLLQGASSAVAQIAQHVYMDTATSGTTRSSGQWGIIIHPMMNATRTSYADNASFDYNLIITDTCDTTRALSLVVTSFDVDKGDTVYFYDGAGTNAPLIRKCNNAFGRLAVGSVVYVSRSNTSRCITVRVKTNGDGKSGTGFSFEPRCSMPCNNIVPHLDTVFYKARNGVIIDTLKFGTGYSVDTIWNADSTSMTFDSIWFPAVNLCAGDELLLRGYGEYIQTSIFTPVSPNPDAISYFKWDMGNGDTSSSGYGSQNSHVKYTEMDCYDVTLAIKDEYGCWSGGNASVRVRLAQMPIKTIYALATICNTDSFLVNVGYSGDNNTISMKTIDFEKTKSKTFDARTFIPDGKCSNDDNNRCYRAPVTFTEFPPGRTVLSEGDICSICINYEHSYMGDYKMSIICPSGGTAMLKKGPGSEYGGGKFSGFPLDGGKWDNDPKCDTLVNPYGAGLDYCFSMNAAYTLVNNRPANDLSDTGSSLIKYAPMVNLTYDFPPIPSPFALAGQTPPRFSGNTTKPSNHEEKYDYYTPEGNFSQLVGCPLNGEWAIELCDDWGADNGWVFNWSLDICGVSAGGGCTYQVVVDSVILKPDSSYGHWEGNKYVGALVNNKKDALKAYILSPDTAGYFPLNVYMYDEFGCRWDTTTSITTVWTPTPELGPDTTLCGSESIFLNASDRHTAVSNQTYKWEPYGNNTDTLTTHTYTGTSTLYTVEVTNEQHNIRCRTRDSLRVSVFPQPTPNFDPGVYPLEGCEPFTITFKNTSVGGDKYHWVFGDGDTSNVMSPSHTYASGTYDFKYYVTSDAGCRDSLVYDHLVTVYPSPMAKFSWEPINPTVLHPEVHFINNTTPKWHDNKYYWEIQYDKDNDVSFHTMREENPTFKWETNGEDISGTYMARLIAKSRNLGPSGNVIECRDTVENKIVLVNDFLQFPNVVTPNGDGVNDRFVIVNLVSGKGYPNNSLDIYNRWGKRVFHKENISSEDDFWDPAATNAPDGTYFWRFSGKGYLGNIERTGMVEVLSK